MTNVLVARQTQVRECGNDDIMPKMCSARIAIVKEGFAAKNVITPEVAMAMKDMGSRIATRRKHRLCSPLCALQSLRLG